jgi:hypothetical protein
MSKTSWHNVQELTEFSYRKDHNTEKQELLKKENYVYCENYRCKNIGGF